MDRPASSRPPVLVKWLWIGFGALCIGLAILGAALPLLPTTPFLLLAAFAFARSSPRLHAWLLAHKRFGPLIHNWNEHGAISQRTKVISVGIMVLMPPASLYFGAPGWTVAIQVVVLTASAVFILTRPSGPKS